MSFICVSFASLGAGIASGRNASLVVCGDWPWLLGQLGGRASSQGLGQQSCCTPFFIVSYPKVKPISLNC